MTWAVLEGAGLLTVVAYMLTGQPASLVITAIAVVLMIALNPGRLERA